MGFFNLKRFYKTLFKSLELFGLVFVFCFFVFPPNPVYAIDYGGVGGDPAYPRADTPQSESIFIYTLEPGTTQEEGVSVINTSASKRTLAVYGADSTPTSGGGFACKQLSEPKTGVGAWITLEKSEVVLEPNTKEIVPFTISVPKNADVGENNGCILIQEVKPKTEGTKGVSLTFRTAIRVAITIPGTIVKKLDIAGFSAKKNKNGFTLTPKIKNSGNVSVDANTSVVTHSVLGANLFRQEGKKEAKFLVFRGDTSEWNFELKQPFWGGWYRSDLAVEYDNGTEAVRMTGSTQFFSWPTPKALAIEIAVPLLLIGLVGLFLFLKTKKISFGIIKKE